MKTMGMNWAVGPGDAALDSHTGVFPSEASLQRVSCRPDFHRKKESLARGQAAWDWTRSLCSEAPLLLELDPDR